MNRKTMAILIVVLAGLLVWAAGSTGSGSLAQGEGGVGPQAVLTPLLQYQGRLTDPGTGEAVADGGYTMTFSLYDVASGGSALWTEEKIVPVQGGLFSTALGDITPLDQSLFNGQALWLGVKVRADAEATPRQQVLPVAYALSLVPGAQVTGESDDQPVLGLEHTGDGNALKGVISSANPARTAIMGVNYGGGFGVAGYTNSAESAAVGGYNGGAGPGVSGESVVGAGGYFSSTNSYGVYAESGSTVAGNAAVYGLIGTPAASYPGQEVGVRGQAPDGYGVAGQSTNSAGVYGYSANSYGVWGTSGSSYGVRGYSSGNYGGHFYGTNGVYGYASATSGNAYAVYGYKVGDSGVAVKGENSGSSGSGTSGNSTNYIGVWGQTGRSDNNWGLYTPDNLYSANIHTTGAVMYLVQNGGSEPLDPGDVVVFSGMTAPLETDGPPVVQVAKATSANSTAVAGVVYSRFNIKAITEAQADGLRADADMEVTPEGAAAPGEYVLLVVQGLAQVKASALDGAIQPGDLLSTAGQAGYATKATDVNMEGVKIAIPGSTFGKVLEPLGTGEGLIYVFVTLQ